MRTSIEINDELMLRALAVSGLTTKREVVERAMTEFVNNRARKDITDLKGKIHFAENYDHKTLRTKAPI